MDDKLDILKHIDYMLIGINHQLEKMNTRASRAIPPAALTENGTLPCVGGPSENQPNGISAFRERDGRLWVRVKVGNEDFLVANDVLRDNDGEPMRLTWEDAKVEIIGKVVVDDYNHIPCTLPTYWQCCLMLAFKDKIDAILIENDCAELGDISTIHWRPNNKFDGSGLYALLYNAMTQKAHNKEKKCAIRPIADLTITNPTTL